MLGHESQSDFARRCGVNRATVTRWKRAGRLVLDAAGRVDIDASINRLESTRGVRHDVAERWRAYRAEQAAAEAKAAAPASQSAPSQPTGDDAPLELDDIGRRTRIAQMLKEEAIARQKQREDQELAGLLIRREAVKKDVADAAAVILGAWELHPDRMAPLLVNQTDQDRVRALLRDEVDAMQREIAAQLDAIGAADADGMDDAA